jgi:UDP-N-acetylmuramoyl-L-alanyl-D-glutamate--2,6-diaminopimelate ligase
LGKLKGVSGRLECVYDGEFKVFIDYAHTPDGLEKVLNALKRICKNRLIVVFGCGGNRDRGKRAKMGEVAKQIADFVVVTSDNPRYEEPMSIISEIEKGVLKSGKEYVLIEDRVLGIEYALNYAKKDDLVVIAGKGGENYQDILGIKQPYNDKDTVVEILARGEK